MKKYTLRDGSTGDVIDKVNEAVGTNYSAGDIGNFVMKNAGSVINSGSSSSPAIQSPAPTTTAVTGETTADTMTKHAVPVAVGGATTLGIKYGLKKGWGMALAGGVVTGGIAHYLKNKQETV